MTINSNDVRNIFLNYFKDNNHIIVKSSSLVPDNDNSLLFTNAGMNQFKEFFLGIRKNLDKNFVSIQRCLRVSGKHNDFENIGYTSRHNTFFEMMGNFSFGLYFKKEAIIYAWNLLINKNLFNLNKNNIIVTVHKNDIDSYNIWLNIIKLHKNSILLVGDLTLNSKNFWRMGDLGLCGYSTEIFYNLYNDKNNKYFSFKKNSNKFLEIWNLVFLEFDLDINNNLNILSNKCIDTGMGLERIVSILQNVKSNFDIDVFLNIKKIISDILFIDINSSNINSFNVISDHIRAIIYLIIDGVYPSNEHRGYVLRKIIRRALIHIRFLKINDIILYKIIYNVLNNLYEFNNLKLNIINIINNIVLREENRFLNTIDYSLKLLNNYIFKLHKNKIYYLSSKIIFLLYDTYGLPLYILIDVCKLYNISINLEKFNIILNYKKKLYKVSNNNNINYKYFINLNILNTLKTTNFLGFNNYKIVSKILYIFNENSLIKETKLGLNCSIILNKTVLYPKSSGQSGDVGYLIKLNNSSKFIILKTRKIGNYIIHYGYIKYGFLKINDYVKCSYDFEHRNIISRNHSCLHILCAVLKKILGKSILFNGSNITKNYFSLDFSYNDNINNYILLKVENIVNYYIWKCIDIKIKYIKNNLLFKDKFNFFGKNILRLVILDNISKEYCSGTHVLNSKDIGFFVIIKVYNLSSNIKRIKAITYFNALFYINKNKYILYKICKILNINIYNLYKKVKFLINKNKESNNFNKYLSKVLIKNIVNIFSNKDIIFYKNNIILFKNKLKFDFLNKSIIFILLNSLYIKYNLSIIFISTLINKNIYFIFLIKNKIFNIINEIFNIIKIKFLNKNIKFKDYFFVKNKNFNINIFYINCNNIDKFLYFDYILDYIKKKL